MTKNYFQLTVVSGALLLGASVSRAQSGNASDVTGTSVPAVVGGFFVGGGTVPTAVSVQVATAISAVSTALTAQALNGTLSSPIAGQVITPAAAAAVGQLLTTATDAAKADARSALSSSGASEQAVDALMSNLPSLLSNPTPGQVQTALSAFDRLVSTSTEAFLAAPPQIFVALHAVLAQISTTAHAPSSN